MTRILNFDQKYSLRRIVIVCVRTCACVHVCTYVCTRVCVHVSARRTLYKSACHLFVCLPVCLSSSLSPPPDLSLFIIQCDERS